MKPHRSNHAFPICAVAGLGLFLTMGTSAVRADITFDTPSNSTVSSLPVDATATFHIDPSTDTITITLQNLEANPTSAAQTLNGVAFVLTTDSKGTGFTYSSQTGTGITITESKSGVFGFTNTGSNFSHWQVNTGVSLGSLGTGIQVTSFNHAGTNATPNLIGEPNSSVAYTTTDPSINTKSNKFLQGTTTIVLNVTHKDIAPSTTIAAMQFEFGTTAGLDVQGLDPPSAPEPSTLALAGLGALGFIGYGLRRRLKK